MDRKVNREMIEKKREREMDRKIGREENGAG